MEKPCKSRKTQYIHLLFPHQQHSKATTGKSYTEFLKRLDGRHVMKLRISRETFCQFTERAKILHDCYMENIMSRCLKAYKTNAHSTNDWLIKN